MSNFKIAIVEDNMIIASAISEMLLSIGYEVPDNATHYTEAIELIHHEKPDLVLLDINLMGKKDGIDVARTLNSDFQIPYIFLTANLDPQTLNRAKEVSPQAYLLKPVTREQLFSAIEIALNNYTKQKNNSSSAKIKQEEHASFFIKDGYIFKKIWLRDILYLESEGNYVNIHLLAQKKIMIRSKLEDLLEQVKHPALLRIHRSYVVNKELIDHVSTSEISINGTKLAIGKSYKDELMKALGITQ
ncbi:MAG: response regulator [Bacteroidia bacterium]|nr:response regulator [Bacteroidia bacterium]